MENIFVWKLSGMDRKTGPLYVTQFENIYVEFSCLYKNSNFENERSNFKIFQQDSDRDDQYACRNNNVMV